MSVKLYLAGPDVFLPDAREIGRHKRQMCREAGFEGLFPLDNDDALANDPAAIFATNCAMMRQADLGVFNLTPFRGPGADGGTAFEQGYLFARGKPVFGYTADARPYCQRVPPISTASGPRRDADGLLIEDFGLFDNLMLARAIAESGGTLSAMASADGRTDPAAFDAFAACLDAVAAFLRHRAL